MKTNCAKKLKSLQMFSPRLEPAITCSKLTIETLQQVVKNVQS